MIEDVALVNICFPKEIDVIAVPQGLLSIASTLHEKGINSKIYDTALDINYQDFTLERIINYLLDINESIIGISTWDSVFPRIILATKVLKERFPEKIIILGGPTISNLKQEVLERFDWVDYCISGEGEYPFYKLLTYLIKGLKPDLTKLPSNVFGKKDSFITQGRIIEKDRKSSLIPILNYSLVDITKYNRFEVSSSRGCPFNCEFCSVNSTLNTLKFRPLMDIFDEIESLLSIREVDCINIVDDNFGLNKQRLKEFCNMFKSKYPDYYWTCYFRLDDLLPETVDMMVEAGCVGAFIGIEVGNSEKLKSLGKFVTNKDILNHIYYASTKMDITASFVWGFPDEIEEHLLDTFLLISNILEFDNILIDLYQLSPLTGTKIKKRLSSCLTFDKNAISGFIYPPYLPDLDNTEINLIKEIPDFFSAFYHEDTVLFGNKFHMVHKFLNECNKN